MIQSWLFTAENRLLSWTYLVSQVKYLYKVSVGVLDGFFVLFLPAGIFTGLGYFGRLLYQC